MPDLVRFTGVLPIGESTVVRLAQLLDTERRRRRTRRDRRALGAWRQAVLVLRWFLDATRGARLAVEDQISVSTAYRYLHEGIDVLAAVAPGLRGRARSAWCAARREVDVIEHSALELRARKERAASVCARQDGPAQMGVAEVGVAQVGLGGVPSPRWRPL